MTTALSTLPGRLRRWRDAQGGGVALWAALAFPVMAAGAALSLDVARLQSLDHDLQSAADAYARAGAAELDQSPASLDRARRAVTQLVANTKRGNTVTRTDVAVDTIRFLSRLPSPSWEAVTSDMVTTDPALARYIEVSVSPETVSTIFPMSTLEAFRDTTLDARAVAGIDIGICGSAPIFICNPFEGQATSLYDAVASADFRRRQLTFVGAGPNAQFTPGNFGWLDPFDNNSGASVLRDQIARTVSDVCVSKARGVSLRPGKISSMSHGFNTKFDMYEHSFGSMAGDPAYAPAINVTKGQANGGSCGVDNSGGGGGGNGKGKGKKKGGDPDADVSIGALGFPRDYGTDAVLGPRVGDGAWNFAGYMAVNHPGVRRVTLDGVTYSINPGNGRVSPETPPSRYSVYRWEIDNDVIPGPTTYGQQAVSEEEGRPLCNTNRPDAGVDPRVLSVAFINCTAVQDSGIDMNGRKSGIPVEAFAKVFVTEPMGKGQGNVILGEVTGLVQPGADVSARDRVAGVR